MMTPDGFQWHIDLVKDRYHALDLTFEQAEKIYQYEEDRDTYSGKHLLTVWEEWDYELSTFEEFLDAGQLKKYQNFCKERSQRYKDDLTRQDHQKEKEIVFYEETIKFYETRFLPDFFADPTLNIRFFFQDKAKIEYLRKEYHRFLIDTKREILATHFRYYRTFKPNALKVSLLRHKLSYIIPAYSHFKDQMDEPTKAIAHFINSKLPYLPDSIEKLLTREIAELKNFNEELLKTSHRDNSGWRGIIGNQAVEEAKENRTMTLLLLDKEKYGC